MSDASETMASLKEVTAAKMRICERICKVLNENQWEFEARAYENGSCFARWNDTLDDVKRESVVSGPCIVLRRRKEEFLAFNLDGQVGEAGYTYDDPTPDDHSFSESLDRELPLLPTTAIDGASNANEQ
jgi:hypothetical protein